MRPMCFTLATIALLSASEQTHCALMVCDSEWVTAALHSVFWVSAKVVAALFSCYVAGATWNCCRLGARSVYTIQPTPVCSVTIRGHIRRMYACLAVTCHLHFWQNDRDLLRATAVTQGCNGYRSKSQHRKKWPWRGKFSRCCCRTRTRDLSITSLLLYHWAIPAAQGLK